MPLDIVTSVLEGFPKHTQWRHLRSLELGVHNWSSFETLRCINSDRFPALASLGIVNMDVKTPQSPATLNLFDLQFLRTLTTLKVNVGSNMYTTLTCPTISWSHWENMREFNFCGECLEGTSERIGVALCGLETLALNSNTFGILRGLALAEAPLTDLTLSALFLSVALCEQVTSEMHSLWCEHGYYSIVRLYFTALQSSTLCRRKLKTIHRVNFSALYVLVMRTKLEQESNVTTSQIQ